MHARVTMRDPKLPHQISLDFKGGDDRSQIKVRCNCRDEELGLVSSKGNVWEVYNNPANHDQSVAEFVPGQSTAKVFNV